MGKWLYGLLTVWRCGLQDAIFVYGRPLVGNILAVLGQLSIVFGSDTRGVKYLLAASRYSDSKSHSGLLLKHKALIKVQSPRLLPGSLPFEKISGRCLVLAEPRAEGNVVQRKGVLLVKFTETAGWLYGSVDRGRLAKYFHIVIEPSWSGYADPAILSWLNWPEPVIVQSPEFHDRELLKALDSNLVPVSYGSGDWIDPSQFAPEATFPDVKYDLIAVSNFGWWKRNHAFVRAVGRVSKNQPNFKAVLVLASLGRTKRRVGRLEALIRYYGARNNLDVLMSLPREQLRLLYDSSQAMLFSTLKEGSSRVIYEAMATNCPVIVLRNNIGVNKDYINDQTGYLVQEAELEALLINSSAMRQERQPRKWFVGNLGPVNTTTKLADDLARAFPEDGWCLQDLAVKANMPEARYVDPSKLPRSLNHWLDGESP